MQHQTDRKVLVTGGKGFIGSELARALRENNYLVFTLGRKASNDSHHIVYDLMAEESPTGLFDGISTIFHLAGKAHDLSENQQDSAEYRLVNTEGTRKLLEAAQKAGVEKFIFFSSVKAVGGDETDLMDESVTLPADTPYGCSKFEAEQLVLNSGYVPHSVVIRPSMVYGLAKKGNLPRMIRAIKQGFFPPLPEVHNHRSMVHVEDIVKAAILAAERPEAAGQIYIVTDSVSYSTRQIYDWIREALNLPPVGWSLPLGLLKSSARIGDVMSYLLGRRFPFDSAALGKLIGSAWYSSAKIETELGFRAEHTLQKSLPDIVRFLNLK
jgi:nucleoside-diphosphate-sugar epimerase